MRVEQHVAADTKRRRNIDRAVEIEVLLARNFDEPTVAALCAAAALMLP